ncbi:hypothetical protein IQ06DRAFT_343770 [Phaeosphaeriaceae sp. SRC1lsM3a]|nr:hypothetical protein IQ06DRAFT_343770 [Stagonospora sp. SRC1lsM3a]
MTTPTFFSNAEDLIPMLDELAIQADAVLASILVIENVRRKYAKTTDAIEKSEYATVLREHGIALETDLSIMKLNANFVPNARLVMWIDEALSVADRADRKARLIQLTVKMRNLEEAMSGLKEGMAGVEDNIV